ncbi:MAG: efflux RND transporter periplasmic adaptor subunit [Pseudomonadota bacterium]|nr:efflux RND transporter periplasmic adaptor subunit [Pseudomonadota bacterium]
MPSQRTRTSVTVLLVIAVLAIVIWIGWRATPQAVPEGLLVASGRIEGRITTIAPKVAGRVLELYADEGESVVSDQDLIALDDEALLARVDAAESQVDALEKQLSAAKTRFDLLCCQVPLEIETTQAALLEAKERLARLRAEAAQARKDAERLQKLLQDRMVSPQMAEQAELVAQGKQNAVNEAEAAVVRTERQLELARLGERRIAASEAELEAFKAQLRQAQATLAEQTSYANELRIRSPVNGTLLTRNVELGERVVPGMALFTLVDLNQLYLKIYVPEPRLGQITLGQSARIFVDAFPDRYFDAKVSKIAQQAEFTPKNVETREERVKLVFAVELAIAENPEGVLKPGMPADAVVRLEENIEWMKP